MAVRTNIYGERGVQYAGCVLNLWERNGSWDSDFYATVWDEEQGKVRDVEYDTTRCGGGGSADIDATDDVLNKVYAFYYADAGKHIDRLAETYAKTYGKGDAVRVVRGRKVKVGTVGTCFWRGKTYNRYARCNEERMGIEVDGERFFLPAENCEHATWEQRLPTAEQREQKMRNYAASCMPYWCRERFGKASPVVTAEVVMMVAGV